MMQIFPVTQSCTIYEDRWLVSISKQYHAVNDSTINVILHGRQTQTDPTILEKLNITLLYDL